MSKRRKLNDSNPQQQKPEEVRWSCHKIWDFQRNGGLFAVDELQDAFSFLEEYGFVVIGDVMSDQENNEGQRLLMRDIQEINRERDEVKIDDLDQVTNDHLPGWSFNGLRLQFGISHGRFAHFCRLRPNIKKVFAHFHGVTKEELCCSWDSIAVTPHGATHRHKLWLHSDQRMFNEQNERIPSWDYRSIQSMLYLTPTNEYTVSFVCSPESHIKYWPAIAQRARIGWLLLDEACSKFDDLDPNIKNKVIENAHRIHVPANSLLLWSSKTFHQNCNALIHRKEKNIRKLQRIGICICMAPSSKRDDKAFKNSLMMAINGRTSTHWAQKMIPHAAKHPANSKGNDYENMVDLKPKLNDAVNEQDIQTMIPMKLANVMVRGYNAKERMPLTLETVHHLTLEQLDEFKVEDLWMLMDPRLRALQPWIEPNVTEKHIKIDSIND